MELDFVSKYLGLPFATYDCYRLVQLIYKNELGIELPNLQVHNLESKKAYFTYLQQINKFWIKVDTPKLFDVVAMAYLPAHPTVVQHFGIYLGNSKMMHTLEKVNAHVVSVNDPSVKTTIKGVYRWRDLIAH